MDTKYYFNLLVADQREGFNSVKTIYTDNKNEGREALILMADDLIHEGQKVVMQAFEMCKKTFCYKLAKEVRA